MPRKAALSGERNAATEAYLKTISKSVVCWMEELSIVQRMAVFVANGDVRRQGEAQPEKLCAAETEKMNSCKCIFSVPRVAEMRAYLSVKQM